MTTSPLRSASEVSSRAPIGRDASRGITTSTPGSTLADVLERVLDKGIVIAGDISISVATTELINIRIRLLIASVDKAREMGINWWENNPHFSNQSQSLMEANRQLMERVESLETELKSLRPTSNPELSSSESLPNSLETLLGDL